ncbi:MAG TPA: transglutaminase N-terminal domain-containing protein [Myxococcota bacterium]|nr:transglutaminase N-terminal domain-containing protein [Myxococcota bacterium]
MARIRVRHVTRYEYRAPVGLTQHRLMVRPRDSHDLRLHEATLVISPTPRATRWAHDVFGNSVCLVDWDNDARTDHLDIAVVVQVRHGGLRVHHHARDGHRLPLGAPAGVHRRNFVPRLKGDHLGLTIVVHVGDGHTSLAIEAGDFKNHAGAVAIEGHQGVGGPRGEGDVGDVRLVHHAVAVVVVEVAHRGHHDHAGAGGDRILPFNRRIPGISDHAARRGARTLLQDGHRLQPCNLHYTILFHAVGNAIQIGIRKILVNLPISVVVAPVALLDRGRAGVVDGRVDGVAAIENPRILFVALHAILGAREEQQEHGHLNTSTFGRRSV